ncbi:MAG: FAD-dependent monooxygenase [Burkholderiales bacterium]|nr:MAG: FAD-dependent monooxygenase [Burkholderiales bacterium]
MRISIVGGGPAGLYFADLIKRIDPRHQVTVFERNRRSVTWGFGVVFSDRALEFLQTDDPAMFDYLMPHMETWPDLTIVHRDTRIPIDGNGFAAVGRLELLNLLQARAEGQGVDIRYETGLDALDALAEADVVVGADGVNSLVRQLHGSDFHTRIVTHSNKFIWYGTSQVFDSLTLTFRTSADGVFCAHHYRYSPRMSTFLVEVDLPTWERAGFADMDAEQTMRYCEAVFAPDLDGHPIVSNNSHWRQFPAIWNDRWYHGNTVLMGDALRTAHFSIGSGTRLAMEDALALARAFREAGEDLQAVFARFEALRRPPMEKIVAAADASLRWYEGMAELMTLTPYEFAYSYMTRTGRIGEAKLERQAPRFMAEYRRHVG